MQLGSQKVVMSWSESGSENGNIDPSEGTITLSIDVEPFVKL
jgi:hypothetical protein